MTRLAIQFLSLFSAVLFVYHPTTRGCSCSQAAPGTCPDIKKSGILFVGTVTDVENPADERRGADQSGLSRYRFRVDENINGVDLKEIDVYSGRGGADCSVHFQPGETYLVSPYENNGRLFATICSATQNIEDAGPLLVELRARRDRKAFASIYGTLRKTQQPYLSTRSDDFDSPLAAIAVELQGGGHTFSTQTDDDGIYRFYGIPAGTYQLEANLPANLELAQTILSEPLPPTVLPENACYQKDLDALPAGRIRGRVLGPDDKPLENADVALFRVDRYNESEMGWWEYQGERKHFEFDHVAPGSYMLVFHNSNRPDPDMPYPRTFYPGSTDLKSARPIVVDGGQQILNADIRLADGQETRALTVRVYWPQNPTPDDVYVSALGSDGSQSFAEKVSPGVFRIVLFREVRYTIYAEQDCGLRWEGNTGTPIGDRESQRMEVDGSDGVTNLNLTLQDTACKAYQTPK
jgi:hypothetical protein